MPWNGSGVFNRTTGVSTGATVWNDALVSGRDVRADDHDTHDEDIATGLELAVARDGQNSPSANLPMGGFRHTNVDDAAARNEYAAAGQVQDQAFTFITAANVAGTADAITLTPSPAITAYAAGQRFSFVVEAVNTGAATVNVSALGVKAIQKLGAALAADDLTIGDLAVIEYDGTQFQLLTPTRTPVLKAGAIGPSELATDAVTTVKIADANVTTAKIADNAVTLAKMAGGTAGNLIAFDASGDPAAVATGTAGQVLTSNGAGAAPTMQSPLWELIGTATASNDATVDFTWANTYRQVVMLAHRALPVTDDVAPLLRTSTDGGVSFDAGATDYIYDLIAFNSTTNLGTGSGGDNNIVMSSIAAGDSVGNNSVEGWWGVIEILSPAEAARTGIMFRAAYRDQLNTHRTVHGSGLVNLASDVDGVRFLFETGNIASGEFACYGLV